MTVVEEAVSAMREARAEIERQRTINAELLKAFKSFIDMVADHPYPIWECPVHAVDIARAAIKKAT